MMKQFHYNMQHPEDFKPRLTPLTELIYHKMTDHNKILLRICVKLTNTMYIPFTFVCDTGAPSQLYINSLTRRLIHSRINIDDDTGIDF